MVSDVQPAISNVLAADAISINGKLGSVLRKSS